MNRLSESPILEKFKFRLKTDKQKIDINKIERFNMNENLKTNEFLNDFFEFVNELKLIYSDGFQISDTFTTLGLTPKLIKLALNINEVKAEYSKLSNEQIAELTTKYSEKGINIFYTDNNSDKMELGIENLKVLLDEIFKLVQTSIDAAKDGINLADLIFVLPITSGLVNIVRVGYDGFEEMKHLSVLEISQLVGILLGKLLFFVRK